MITNHDDMGQWIGFSPVTVIKEGATGRYGVGSERLMHGPPGVGKIVEQVIATNPGQCLRYRVTQGSPLTCHQGEVTLKQVGDATKLHWAIRFRPKLAGAGPALRRVLQNKLNDMLDNQLKPYIERRQSELGG